MIESVPEGQFMDVDNAFMAPSGPDVPPFLMSRCWAAVEEADAEALYAALMDFKDVVKSHPITPAATTLKKGREAKAKNQARAPSGTAMRRNQLLTAPKHSKAMSNSHRPKPRHKSTPRQNNSDEQYRCAQ